MEQSSKDPNDLIIDLITMRRDGSRGIADIYRKNTKTIIKAWKQQKVPPSFQGEEHKAPELLPKLNEITEWHTVELKEMVLLAKVLQMKKKDPIWNT